MKVSTTSNIFGVKPRIIGKKKRRKDFFSRKLTAARKIRRVKCKAWRRDLLAREPKLEVLEKWAAYGRAMEEIYSAEGESRTEE